MKTNIGIVTTDEEREAIARSLGDKGMVSRKRLTEAVHEYVQMLIRGNFAEPITERQDVQEAQEELTQRTRTLVDGFTPSRGDEPYLFKSKDPELTARCSAALDALESLDSYVWGKLEENRRGD